MNQSLRDQLKEWKRQHGEKSIERKKKPIKRKAQKKKQEKFTDSDLKFLMGTNRQILSRGKGRAWRNER
ncbi:hypothetical protein [Bacillus sp. ISL-45]|uniref:hypothetical protein n=1 Tax=Bacillus sp. ISL-45 TaxID=2819128 RepID=UPI001BE75FDA|nr:hypothetical protein [Bacillus sp. ISL-45]MBT2661930.1 hypothetical protein [Bacillus sp. ISL-45]